MLVGHLNLAACHLRLNNNFKCMKECEKVGCPEMRCRQGKQGFLELSPSTHASWFCCWIDSVQTQICFQLSLLSAWKQIVIFGRKREATREFFWTGRENSRKYVCVRRLSSREMTISSCESVLFFCCCFILLAKYVSLVCWFSTKLRWEVLTPVNTVYFFLPSKTNTLRLTILLWFFSMIIDGSFAVFGG